jgi:hypothetical protein
MTIRSLTVYADLTPWDDWTPAIEAEMERLGIPVSDRSRIQFTILRPLSAKPKRKKKGDTKAPLKMNSRI